MEKNFIVNRPLRLSMGSISKSFALVLILVLTISSLTLMMIKPASAQSIPKPSVPTFTLSFVNNSYYVPPTYGISPYTGQNVVTKAGYELENLSIVLTIKNQPYSYSFINTVYNLYYDIRTKGYFGGNWTELYPVVEGLSEPIYRGLNVGFSQFLTDNSPQESNSEYTMVSFSVGANGYYLFTALPANAQVDFQVQALVGHNSTAYSAIDPFAPEVGTQPVPSVAFDVSSGWSGTQTVTIPATSLSPTPAPSSSTSTLTPTPTLTSVSSSLNSSLLLIALVVIVFLLVVIIFLLLYMRKRRIAFSQAKITSTP